MAAYYNEHDTFAAAWLRELIKAGHIAPGVVDERSIEDVTPSDLAGFTQCHFFAGIGVWSYALRRAGWPDDKPVWTGSCPCQPFSAAGKGVGFADERHLWPAWFHLITTAKPEAVPVFGEQVASSGGLTWLDLVQTDMEGAGYAFGATDLCAAGVGAPHIRQRLFFVGHPLDEGLEGHAWHGDRTTGWPEPIGSAPKTGGINKLAAEAGQAEEHDGGSLQSCEFCGYEFDADLLGRYGCPNCAGEGCGAGGLGNTDGEHSWGNSGTSAGAQGENDSGEIGDGLSTSGADDRPGPTNGLWRDADWLFCRDGKWRPVEPGLKPLVDGAAEKLVRGSDPGVDSSVAQTAKARTGRLKGYGNAINSEVAYTFIRAYMEQSNGL